MQKAFDIVAGMIDRFDRAEGACDRHGPSAVLVGKGKGWHCDKCFEEEIAKQAREEHIEKMRAGLMTVSKIPSKFIGQRFTAATPAQKTAREQAIAFRTFVIEQKRWAALVLTGKVGTGKTLLACELAGSMIGKFGIPIRYATAASMIGEIQSTYGQDGKSAETEIARFANYGVLIIDEIDAGRASADAQMLLTEIINRRYASDRPVIVITNQPFEDLAQFVGDRVHDRLHENAFVCSFDWLSFRRQPVSA